LAQQWFQQQYPQPDAARWYLMNPVTEHRFDSVAQMQEALYQWSLSTLQRALAQQGQVSVLLSGGRTPLPFYARLAQAPLPWSRINLALCDERWISTDLEISNEHAIRHAFAGNPQALQQFIAMKTHEASAGAAVDSCNQRYRQLPWPSALTVLGMGSDGHTASLFPGATGIEYALQEPTFCAAIDAIPSPVTGPCSERMTLTLWALLQSRHSALLFTGDDKWRVYQAAREREDPQLPISLLLHRTTAFDVFWCP
jgi:6-phosphogluconolactonase